MAPVEGASMLMYHAVVTITAEMQLFLVIIASNACAGLQQV